jgi:exodeoxyribonuclease V beta subunit
MGRRAVDREVAGELAMLRLVEDRLPGGITAGLMLHEILEEIPFSSLCHTPDFSAWCQLAPVAEIITGSLDRNNIDLVYRAEVEAMIYHALRCTIPTGAGRSIPGLCQCRRIVREMEFLFPYPDKGHPPLSEPRSEKMVIERGFIKGYIDLVAEYDGLVYFADWKSDVLSAYTQLTVEQHIATHYELQVKLYLLALVRALGLRSEAQYERCFGGLVYLFLRGLRCAEGSSAAGIYFGRPSWFDVLAYEREFK